MECERQIMLVGRLQQEPKKPWRGGGNKCPARTPGGSSLQLPLNKVSATSGTRTPALPRPYTRTCADTRTHTAPTLPPTHPPHPTPTCPLQGTHRNLGREARAQLWGRLQLVRKG